MMTKTHKQTYRRKKQTFDDIKKHVLVIIKSCN